MKTKKKKKKKLVLFLYTHSLAMNRHTNTPISGNKQCENFFYRSRKIKKKENVNIGCYKHHYTRKLFCWWQFTQLEHRIRLSYSRSHKFDDTKKLWIKRTYTHGCWLGRFYISCFYFVRLLERWKQKPTTAIFFTRFPLYNFSVCWWWCSIVVKNVFFIRVSCQCVYE